MAPKNISKPLPVADTYLAEYQDFVGLDFDLDLDLGNTAKLSANSTSGLSGLDECPPLGGAGLSIKNKVDEFQNVLIQGNFKGYRPKRTFYIYNKTSKNIIAIDSDKARLSRMQRRIYGYSKTLSDGIEAKTLFNQINRNKRKTAPNTYMATLTYRPDVKACPSDIKRTTEWIRRHFGTWLLSYAWCAEVTRAGALHYHLFVTLAKGSLPFLDRPQGQRAYIPWDKGFTKVEKARSVFYLSKYIGKEYQKDYSKFPKGMRSFGLWVSPQYAWEIRNNIRMSAFPSWVRGLITEEEIRQGKISVVRERGGGWNLEGSVFRSDWEMLGMTSGDDVISLEELERWRKLTADTREAFCESESPPLSSGAFT